MPVRTRDVLEYLEDVGIYVFRAAATLPATTTTTQFNVTGKVLVTGLIFEVTTAIQAQANAIKIRHTPTGGSVGDASGTIDINGFAVGDLIIVQGATAAGALSQSPTSAKAAGGATGWTALANPIFLITGALALNTAATNTGALSAHLFYKPVLPGSKVVAA